MSFFLVIIRIIFNLFISFFIIFVIILMYGTFRRWEDKEFIRGIVVAIVWYILTIIVSIIFPDVSKFLHENKKLYIGMSIAIIEISVAILNNYFY